jgi:serine-type D-Ala-D-Ala carboxypeptidase/endopeptidase
VEISKLDSPRIRGRDLLNHAAGFVTDDPWGDRQTPLPELEFVRLLRDGVTFARIAATAMEYSNLASRCSDVPYQSLIKVWLQEKLRG